MQAQFLCFAHNLLQLFERVLAREHQLHPTAEQNRRAKRLAAQLAQIRQAGAQLSPLLTGLQRLTQCSVKLLRWLRAHFFSELSYADFLPALRRLYTTFRRIFGHR